MNAPAFQGIRPTCAAPVLGMAALLVFGTTTTSAAAQEPPRPAPDTIVHVLDELVVRTGRHTTTTGGASAIVVKPDSLLTGPVPTLETVLRELPLVQIRRNSRGEAQLAIRGSSERQIAVLVDGVPVSLGWDHRADLSILPAGAATSVMLVRGLSSLLLGPNVLGGVVEVGIARGPNAFAVPEPLALSGSVDHTGGYVVGGRAARFLSGSAGQILVRAGGGWRESPGVAAPPGVPAGFESDGRLLNTDLEQVDGFLSGRLHHDSGVWLSFTGLAMEAERGIAPETHVARPRWWRNPDVGRALLTLSAGTGERDTPIGSGDVEVSAGFDRAEVRIADYADGSFDVVNGTESGDTRTGTFRLVADHTLGARGQLKAATTWADVQHAETITSESPGGRGIRSDYRQRLWSLGSELSLRAPGSLLGLTAGRFAMGLAWDGADTPESGDKPPIGRLNEWGGRIGASGLAGGAVLLHSSASRRARFPALRELYSGALGRFEPNPELRPEILTAGELGGTFRLGLTEIQSVGFASRLSDAIVRVRTPAGRFQRVNRHELSSEGVELLVGAGIGRTRWAADLTIQRVRARDDTGAEVTAEYQPAVVAGLDVSLPVAAWSAAASLDYTGPQECVNPDRADPMQLDASAAVDLRARRGFSLGRGRLGRFETTLAAENVMDAAVQDQCGLARPGRTLRLEIRTR